MGVYQVIYSKQYHLTLPPSLILGNATCRVAHGTNRHFSLVNSLSTFKHSRIGRLPYFLFFLICLWSKIVVMLKQCCKCLTGALDVCRLQIKKLHRSFFYCFRCFSSDLFYDSLSSSWWRNQSWFSCGVNKSWRRNQWTRQLKREKIPRP